MNPLKLREDWLNRLAQAMEPKFKALGHPLPSYRVSCGFTSRGRSNAIGECWAAECSKDAHHEIFVVPTMDDPIQVAAVLVHELAHAAVGLKESHSGAFKTVVLALGLTGPMTATVAGPEFERLITPIINKIGTYPHGKLSPRNAVAPRLPGDPFVPGTPGVSSIPPSRSGRLVKCVCVNGANCMPTKFYAVRGDLNKFGFPKCPCCDATMIEA